MDTIDEMAIIEAFVSRWVLRDRRERALFQLTRKDKRSKFVDRLNHQWATVLDMRYLVKVEKAQDCVEGIEQIMRINSNYTYYIISNYRELDGKVVQLSEALTSVYARGFASLLVSTSADSIYLETEQIQGAPARFTGHRRGS